MDGEILVENGESKMENKKKMSGGGTMPHG